MSGDIPRGCKIDRGGVSCHFIDTKGPLRDAYYGIMFKGAPMDEDQQAVRRENLSVYRKMFGTPYYAYVWRKVLPDGTEKNLTKKELHALHAGIAHRDPKKKIKWGDKMVPEVNRLYLDHVARANGTLDGGDAPVADQAGEKKKRKKRKRKDKSGSSKKRTKKIKKDNGSASVPE